MNSTTFTNETLLNSIANNFSASPISDKLDINAFYRKIATDRQRQIAQMLRMAGILASLMNVLVLVNPKLKESLFRYLLVMAIVDMFYSLMVFTLGFMSSLCLPSTSEMCGPNLYLTFLVMFILMSDFLTSSLALMNILLEIFLTTQRMLMITNKKSALRNASVTRVCWTLFGVSLLLYFPFLFMNKIEPAMPVSGVFTNTTLKVNINQNRYNYRRVKSQFGDSEFAFWFTVTVNGIRIFLVVGVLFVLNCVAVFKFHSYFYRKYAIKERSCKIIQFKSL
jgi:hypothetical protein